MDVEIIDLLSSDEEEGDKTKNTTPVLKLTPSLSITKFTGVKKEQNASPKTAPKSQTPIPKSSTSRGLSILKCQIPIPKNQSHAPKHQSPAPKSQTPTLKTSSGSKYANYFSPNGPQAQKISEEVPLPLDITSYFIPKQPTTKESRLSPEIIIEEVTPETQITFGPTTTVIDAIPPAVVIPRTPVADKKDDNVPKILSVLSLKRSASEPDKKSGVTDSKRLHESPLSEQAEKSNLTASELAFEEFKQESRKLQAKRPLSPVIKMMCKRFNNCDVKFRESEHTVELIKRTTYNMALHPDNPWVYMKILSDELSAHKKGKVAKRLQLEQNIGLDAVVEEEEEEDGMDEKTRRRLKKLYRNQEKILKRIKQLEEEEVNWSDDSDSTYMKEDMYKKRLMANYKMIDKLTKNNSIKRVIPKIFFHGSNYPAINEAVEKFVNCLNRKEQFPNFDAMCKIVKEASKKLGLSKLEIEHIARDALPVVGKQMQRHRCDELHSNLFSLLADQVTDPAECDPDLERKLEENRKQYEKREAELLALFVTKEEQEKETKKETDTETSKIGSPTSSKAASRASSPVSRSASAASRSASPVRPSSRSDRKTRSVSPTSRPAGPSSRSDRKTRSVSPTSHPVNPRSRSASPTSRSAGPSSCPDRTTRSVSPTSHPAGPSSRSDHKSRSVSPASRSVGPRSRSSSPAGSDTSSVESHISEDSRCDENSLHGSDSDMDDSDSDEDDMEVNDATDEEEKNQEVKQKERAMGPVSPPSIYSSSQNTPDMDEPASKPQSFKDAYLKHVASLTSQPEPLEDSSEELENLEEKITALSSSKPSTEKSTTFADVFKKHVSSQSQDSVEVLSDSNDAPEVKSEPKFNSPPVVMSNKDSPQRTQQTARKSFTKQTPPMQTPEVTSSSQIDDDDCVVISD